MIRLSDFPVREKVTDDIDWKNVPMESWEMNFRRSRVLHEELKLLKRLTTFASVLAAVAMVAISVLNALCPFLFGNFETVLLLFFAAAVPCVLAWRKPYLETGIVFYVSLVALLLISNLGLIFMDGYRNEFYSIIFIAIIVPFVLFVLDKVASMYIHWATASPMLDKAAMEALRGVWRERFNLGFFVPAKLKLKDRVGDKGEIDKAFQQIAYYPGFLMSVFLMCVVSIFAVQLISFTLFAQAALISASVLVVGSALLVASRHKGVIASVLSAFLLFCTVKTFRHHPGTIQYPTEYKLRLNLCYSAIMMLCFAVNTFWFPWALGSFTLVDSASQLIFNIALQFTIVLCLAPALLFAMAVVAIGPVMRAFEQLSEGEAALFAHQGWTQFDCYLDRISKSGCAAENECVWIGFHQQLQFPLLIPTSLFNQHAHFLGGSGAGKTGLGLATLTAQMIRQKDGPVIVIDGKGDNALFQSVKKWCEEDKRKFKWFTTSAEKSTYLFNPLGQAAIEKFSLSDIVGFFLASLNLFHGTGYGRGWFTQASKTALAEAAKLERMGENKPATLEMFCQQLEVIMQDKKELAKSAKHVLYMLQTLAEFPQLNNAVVNDPPDLAKPPHPACKHAIDMLEVIKKKQVVYFSFDSLTDRSSAGELSRMAIFSIIAAAKAYESEKFETPHVTVIIDEAQNIVASNIGDVIEMARSRGIHFVFSHQSRDQLKLDGSTDLRSDFDTCTQVKLHFDAQGETVKHLQEISGEVGYADGTWEQFMSDLAGGNAAKEFALCRYGNPAIATVRMQVGPRLTVNEIQDASGEKNSCIISVNRKDGVAQYRGAFPIHIDYPINAEQFQTNTKLRWPAKDGETISTAPHWPHVDMETVVREEVKSKEEQDAEILKQLQEAIDGPEIHEKPPEL